LAQETPHLYFALPISLKAALAIGKPLYLLGIWMSVNELRRPEIQRREFLASAVGAAALTTSKRMHAMHRPEKKARSI
jgi:hypothetical protein